MTSCNRTPTCTCNFYQETIEIPCMWHSPLECGVSVEDPSCFRWWEGLNDPLLTSFIDNAAVRNKEILLAGMESKEKLLQTVNRVSIEVAKGYVELRGLQMRLQVLDELIKTQNEISTTSKGLSNRGVVSIIEENEDRKNLNPLLVQRSLVKLSIQKTIFHLSTLLGYPPGFLTLCEPQDLPELPCEIPVGLPMDLICHNPTVKEARKAYEATRSEQAFHQFQQTILNALENTESALATFNHERERFRYLEDTRRIKAESYQLTKDLYDQGLKDEEEMLRARQEFLAEENAVIQSKVDLLLSYLMLYQTLNLSH